MHRSLFILALSYLAHARLSVRHLLLGCIGVALLIMVCAGCHGSLWKSAGNRNLGGKVILPSDWPVAALQPPDDAIRDYLPWGFQGFQGPVTIDTTKHQATGIAQGDPEVGRYWQVAFDSSLTWDQMLVFVDSILKSEGYERSYTTPPSSAGELLKGDIRANAFYISPTHKTEIQVEYSKYGSAPLRPAHECYVYQVTVWP